MRVAEAIFLVRDERGILYMREATDASYSRWHQHRSGSIIVITTVLRMTGSERYSGRHLQAKRGQPNQT